MSKAKRKPALRIIHSILTTTRYLAGTGCGSKTIVDILDKTEYLVDIALRQDADEFELHLAHLGQKFPAHFGRLQEDFNTKLGRG